jgi:hypothetical protein
MSRTIFLTLAAAAVFGASAVSAHHDYAAYDREHLVTIEGNLEQVVYANPHVLMTVRTADAAYDIEWGNLLQLNRWHVAKGTLKVGDHVILTGRALRDPAVHRLSLLTEIRRPADGWQWSRSW